MRQHGVRELGGTGPRLQRLAQGTWASLSVAGAPTIATGNAQPACAALNDGAAISLFSGNTGTFTTLPAAPGAAVDLDRYVAVCVDGSNVYAYSALLGSFASASIPGPVMVVKQQMYALIDDGTNLTAYSATKGAFASPFPSSGLTALHRAQIATLSLPGSNVPAAVYSSYRNAW